jgi:hypothetical protein
MAPSEQEIRDEIGGMYTWVDAGENEDDIRDAICDYCAGIGDRAWDIYQEIEIERIAKNEEEEEEEEDEDENTYYIIRFYRDDRPSETIETGLTREEAVEHCKDPSTSTGEYFDGFELE